MKRLGTTALECVMVDIDPKTELCNQQIHIIHLTYLKQIIKKSNP